MKNNSFALLRGRAASLFAVMLSLGIVSDLRAQAHANGQINVTPVDYSMDVEDWWATHVFNPNSPNFDVDVPILPGGRYEVNHSGTELATIIAEASNDDINLAKTIVLGSGVTVTAGGAGFERFDPTPAPGKVVKRNNVHIICEDPNNKATINGLTRINGHLVWENAYNDKEILANPQNNYYFKNIKFKHGYWYSFQIMTANNVFFDNCEFGDTVIRDTREGVAGVHSVANVNGMWFYRCKFNRTGKAITADGIHNIGFVECEMGSEFPNNGGGFLFLTNDDVTFDFNGNGILEPNESREATYIVVYKTTWEANSLGATEYTPFIVHGSNALILENELPLPCQEFAEIHSRTGKKANNWSNVYDFRNYVIRDNVLPEAPRDVFINMHHHEAANIVGVPPRSGLLRAHGNTFTTGSMNDSKWIKYTMETKVDLTPTHGNSTEAIPFIHEGPMHIWDNTVSGTVIDYTDPYPASDTTPPTVPGNLRAANISPVGVTLAWDVATDADSGVYRHNIYRDGTYIGFVEAPERTFGDGEDARAANLVPAIWAKLLTPDTTYAYTVTAVDQTGFNESAHSAPLNVTTLPNRADLSYATSNGQVYPESPSDADAAQEAAYYIAPQYFLDERSDPLDSLFDGSVPAETPTDANDEGAVYLKLGPQSFVFRLDLGSVHNLAKINSFSGHSYRRAAQEFVVYGYRGETPPALAGDLVNNGWEYIGMVETQSAPGNDPLHFASISGSIGLYRHLAVSMRLHEANWLNIGSRLWPAFHTELDVFGDAVLEQAPGIPVNVSGRVLSETSLELNWAEPAAGTAFGFEIERSPQGQGVWTSAGSVGLGILTLIDSGLAVDTSYDYRVRAFNDWGESSWVSVTLSTPVEGLPDAPTGLQGTAPFKDKIQLVWVDNSSNEQRFEIERSSDGGSNWQAAGARPVGVTSFADYGLTPGQAYLYRVRSVNANGPSSWTLPVEVTTLVTNTNHLSDGGMEILSGDFSVGWQQRDNMTIAANEGRNNSNALLHDGPPTGSTYTFPRNSAPLSSDTDYIFSAWIRTSGVEQGNGIQLYVDEDGERVTSGYQRSEGVWTQVSVSFRTSSAYDGIVIQLQNSLQSGDKAWVDDVSLEPLGETAPPVFSGDVDADLDGNQINDFVEYALALSGMADPRAMLPRPAIVATAGEYLALEYSLPLDPPADVDYSVLVSDDLITWTPSSEQVGDIEYRDGRMWVTIRDEESLAANSPRFIMVQLTHLP